MVCIPNGTYGLHILLPSKELVPLGTSFSLVLGKTLKERPDPRLVFQPNGKPTLIISRPTIGIQKVGGNPLSMLKCRPCPPIEIKSGCGVNLLCYLICPKVDCNCLTLVKVGIFKIKYILVGLT